MTSSMLSIVCQQLKMTLGKVVKVLEVISAFDPFSRIIYFLGFVHTQPKLISGIYSLIRLSQCFFFQFLLWVQFLADYSITSHSRSISFTCLILGLLETRLFSASHIMPLIIQSSSQSGNIYLVSWHELRFLSGVVFLFCQVFN